MDMMNIVVILVIVVIILVLLVVNQRQKQATKGTAKATKRSSGAPKKSVSESKPNNVEHADTGKEQAIEKTQEDVDWESASPSPDHATVSVETVDYFTEYKVYKQFGYFQKAADSLSLYLKTASAVTPELMKALVLELAELCLQAKKLDQLSGVIEQHRTCFEKSDLENIIREGLKQDSKHLALRVLAEELLGWNVQKTDQEVGVIADSVVDDGEQSLLDDSKQEQDARHDLVKGPKRHFNIRGDEQEVILKFYNPEKSYRLLKEQLPYEAAIRCLNNAIKQVSKPASLIIDALALDYRQNNINVFAQHLWRLYYVLGQYGLKVKERMLGWGYNLGNHPMFDQLESMPNDTQLREIGMEQGYLPISSSALKAKRRPLVKNPTEGQVKDATPAEKIQQEVESLLEYGQLEQAVDILEQSIFQYPQESQLYITLFDLHERSEDWGRLQKLLQEIRAKIKTPPEEVVLAMSQLQQRINQRGEQSK